MSRQRYLRFGMGPDRNPAILNRVSSSLPLRRVHLFWIAVAYSVLVLYGSALPLDFKPVSSEQAIERVKYLLCSEFVIGSRSDLVINFLLLVPLGFLSMGGLCVDRRRSVAFAAPLVVVPWCILLAVSMESAQLFLPRRFPQMHDIVLQSLGSLIGIVLWWVGGQSIIEWCRRIWTATRIDGSAGLLLPGYLVLLVTIHVIPTDSLITSPGELYDKYCAGRVQLLPFCSPCESILSAVQRNLWNVAYFVPVGVLWAPLSNHKSTLQRRVCHVLTLGLAVTVGVEMAQLLADSRRFDTTDIITGSFGVLLGWFVGNLMLQNIMPISARMQSSRLEPWLASGLPSRRILLGCAILGWLGVLAMSHWEPFDFVWDVSRAGQRLDHLGWIPFANYQTQSADHAFEQFLGKTLLFLPLGALFALSLPAAWKWRSGLLALSGTLGIAVILEAGQLFLPSRYPGCTDILIELFGGWVGYVLVKRGGTTRVCLLSSRWSRGREVNPKSATTLLNVDERH